MAKGQLHLFRRVYSTINLMYCATQSRCSSLLAGAQVLIFRQIRAIHCSDIWNGAYRISFMKIIGFTD